MSDIVVPIHIVNTVAEDRFALKESGYLKSLKLNLKESIRIGKGASVLLAMAYLPITLDVQNPDQRLYTIYGTPTNTFSVLPDSGAPGYNYTATIVAGNYSAAELMTAVRNSLNYRADGGFLTIADSTVFGLDWDVELLGTDNKTTITFNRWEQTDPDETYLTAGSAAIGSTDSSPADAGLVFNSVGSRDLIRDTTYAGSYLYMDSNIMTRDNWEVNCVVNTSDPNPNAFGVVGEFMIGSMLEEAVETVGYPPNIFGSTVATADYFSYGLGVDDGGRYQFNAAGVTAEVIGPLPVAPVARADDTIRVQKSGNTIYYSIEFGETAITGVSQADPGVFTKANHLFDGLETIIITGATGMPGINGTWVVNVIDANTFTLEHPITGAPLDTAGFALYDPDSALFTFDPISWNVTIPQGQYIDKAYVGAAFGEDNVVLTDFSYYVRNVLRTGDLADTAISWNDVDGLPNGILKYILGFSGDLPPEGANTYTWTGDADIKAYGDTGNASVYLVIDGCKIESYDGATGKREPFVATVPAVIGDPLTYRATISEFIGLGIERPTDISSFELTFKGTNGNLIAYQGSAEALLLIRKGDFQQGS
jgi:hypothetical protein